ncbi:hypothetical protein ACWF82_02995 [Nocardia sp. NPDC055053]
MIELADVHAVHTERRTQLGAFLKSRRAKITPGDVGLPPAPAAAHPACAAKRSRNSRG